MTSLLGFLAGSWAVVMGVSPLLQVRRMRQRQSSADVSIGYLLILFPGFALWIAYGLASSDLALVIPNIVSLVICAVTIGYALKLRPRRTQPEQGPSVGVGYQVGGVSRVEREQETRAKSVSAAGPSSV